MLGRFGHDPRTLAVGNATTLALALVRNVVVARLLGPEQFGIAATLLLIGLFFDAFSDIGVDRYLIQSREGDDPEVQGAAQAFNVARGWLQALLIVAAAWPLSLFFNTPGASPAYMGMALVPLLISLVHLDPKRVQREHNFGPEVVMSVSAELASLAVAVAAALVMRDYHAVLAALIARALTLCLLSHLLAERRYQLRARGDVLQRLGAFGWPLLLSGMTIFLSLQSDRAMVSALLGPYALGVYSAAAMLTYAPAHVAVLTFGRLILVRMSRVKDDPLALDREFDRFLALVLTASIFCCIGFASFGSFVAEFLFGPAYIESAAIFVLFGALQSVRLYRVLPTTASFALGRTKDLLGANLMRLLAIPLGFAGFAATGELIAIVSGFLAGELIALAWAFMRYNRVRGAGWLRHMKSVAILIGGMAGAIAVLPLIERSIMMAAISFVGLTLTSLLCLAIAKPNAAKSLVAFARW